MLVSSCTLNALRPFPYGKWENAELGLVLDINRNYNKEQAFSGFYIENGEEIDVYVFFSITHGYFWIIRESDLHHWGGVRDAETTIFDGRYRVRGERLYYTLTPFWQEQTGITDTIVFERIVSYDDLLVGADECVDEEKTSGEEVLRVFLDLEYMYTIRDIEVRMAANHDGEFTWYQTYGAHGGELIFDGMSIVVSLLLHRRSGRFLDSEHGNATFFAPKAC